VNAEIAGHENAGQEASRNSTGLEKVGLEITGNTIACFIGVTVIVDVTLVF